MNELLTSQSALDWLRWLPRSYCDLCDRFGKGCGDVFYHNLIGDYLDKQEEKQA